MEEEQSQKYERQARAFIDSVMHDDSFREKVEFEQGLSQVFELMEVFVRQLEEHGFSRDEAIRFGAIYMAQVHQGAMNS